MWPSQTEAQRLLPTHAQAIGLHLLALDADDRYARFGCAIGDEALLRWLRRMPWQSLQWWGIWCPHGGGLLGALQLSQTGTEGVRELAMSVHAKLRWRGIGTSLLSSAIAQSPAVERLACHHGHQAIRRMAHRLGWGCTRLPTSGWVLEVRNAPRGGHAAPRD